MYLSKKKYSSNPVQVAQVLCFLIKGKIKLENFGFILFLPGDGQQDFIFLGSFFIKLFGILDASFPLHSAESDHNSLPETD